MIVRLLYLRGGVSLWHGDCRDVMRFIRPVDAVVTDPPYGQTRLHWDRWVSGWIQLVPCNSVWVFGPLRMYLDHPEEFQGWKLSHDIVWEKHNGSSMHNDRFRKVHDLAAHFYRGRWSEVYHCAQKTHDAKPKSIRRKHYPKQWNRINPAPYTSIDGGPRLMRSVIRCRSTHGRAIHPTQKPIEILNPLIGYSVPPGGTVLDPFAGSGSTLVAARALGRRAIGIEGDLEMCEKVIARLEGET